MIPLDNEFFVRKIERSDLPSRVKWINDPKINATLTFDYPVSLASTEAWFAKTSLDSTKANFTFFLGEDKPVGFGGLIKIDTKNRNAELYVTIGESDLHGKGLGKKAVDFICEYGFDVLGLHKIYLTTLSHNAGAIKLYEKCGFSLEGKFCEHIYLRGKYQDMYYYAKFRGVSP